MDWDDCSKCKYANLGINEEPCDKCVNGDGDSSSENKFEPREEKVKTYKTWEVIKMLTENPKLKFKNKEGYGAAICGDMFNITGGTDVSRRFHIYDEWELAQEPVSFMEAVNNALENCSKIKNEKWNEYYTINQLFQKLSYGYNDEYLKILLNGKWLTQEEEE